MHASNRVLFAVAAPLRDGRSGPSEMEEFCLTSADRLRCVSSGASEAFCQRCEACQLNSVLTQVSFTRHQSEGRLVTFEGSGLRKDKRVKILIGKAFANELLPLFVRRSVASLSFFYRKYFGKMQLCA